MPFGRTRALVGPLALIAFLAWAGASPLFAQTEPEPIGRYVVDVQGTLARYNQPNQVASWLGVGSASLPSFGLGAQAAAHVYPFRWRAITFGVGASAVWTRGTRTPTDPEGEPLGPAVETRLLALAPQVSLNFGTRKGWSYISAGFGPASYTFKLADASDPTSLTRISALNFGGGARWFAKKHLAFSFDLRWYSLGDQAETSETPYVPSTTRMVFSAGMSVR
jgi:hypothetical protein